MPSPRVLWLTSHYPNAADPVTGVFFRTQARALVRAGVSVTVVAPTPFVPPLLHHFSAKWDRYRRIPSALEDQGVRVEYPRYVAIPSQNRIGVPDRVIARTVRRGRDLEAYGLVHGHYSYPEGLAAVRVGRAWRRPVVVTLHGDDASTFPDSSRLARNRFRAAIGGADVVLAVSEKLASRTETLTGTRPMMAPIGVSMEEYRHLPERMGARHALGLDPHRFIVLFVGYLEERKGIAELVDAMHRPDLHDAQCVVVGDGPLRHLLTLAANIHHVGAVANEEVRRYLAAADVLVLPSREEGTPTVVVEAGAAKLPVAASAVGGTPALLGDDRGMLFPARDAGALADAIASIRRAPEPARRRADRLHRFVLDHYDVDANARRLAAIYQETIRIHRSEGSV